MKNCDGPVQTPANTEELRRQHAALSEIPGLLDIVERFMEGAVVLNDSRQVVLCNEAFRKAPYSRDVPSPIGLCPGQLLDCINSQNSGGGCAMTEACRECGAAKAISACERGGGHTQQCAILRQPTGDVTNLLVKTSPLEAEGQKYCFVAFQDISHETRRKTLDGIFLHDIANLIGGIWGGIEMIQTQANQPERIRKYAEAVAGSTHALIRELECQRQLLAAESGDLDVWMTPVNSRDFLHEVAMSFVAHPLAQQRRLVVDPETEAVEFVTDKTLLSRVIGNMVKNGLEAVAEGSAVALGCRTVDGMIEFWTHNPGLMPSQVRPQVFRRSFTTKGKGRGLGTYSMRLLTEKYLGGDVRFSTDVDEGTVFVVALPLGLTATDPRACPNRGTGPPKPPAADGAASYPALV